jgi:hypothetical protein
VVVTANSVDAADASPACSIQTIIGSDPDDLLRLMAGKPREPDFVITGPLTAKLRAEKSKGPIDRLYLLFVTCQDDSGNVSQPGVAIVTVPHDNR